MTCCVWLAVSVVLLVVGSAFVLWAVVDVARRHDHEDGDK